MTLFKKILASISIILFVLSLVVGSKVIHRRYLFEQQNKSIETVLSFNELQTLALLGGVELKNLLKTLKDEQTITSIAVEEDTLQDYVDQGKVTLLRGSEVINLYRIGYINRYVLTHLYKKTQVKADHFYLFVDEIENYEHIKKWFEIEFGKEKIINYDRWNILEVVDEQEDLLNIGLGISKEKISLIEKAGLHVITRLKNSNRINTALIKEKFQSVTDKKIPTIIFEGNIILGFPKYLKKIQEKIQKNDLNIGYIEFSKQYGMTNLAKKIPESMIKVHSITEDEMKTIPYKKAVVRYLRSIKERGVKIIFLHPFLTPNRVNNIIDVNLNYFKDIAKGIYQFQYQLNPIQKLPVKTYQPAQKNEIIIISIGIIIALIWLINHFFSLSAIQLLSTFGIGLTYIFLSLKYMLPLQETLTLIAAIVFPVLSIIFLFSKFDRFQTIKTRILTAFIYIPGVTCFTILGTILTMALLSNVQYLFSIQRFFGVKISFLLPLLFIFLYFFLRPHRISSIYYIFKRLFSSIIRTSSLLAVLICSVIIFIYILRSGNYISFSIPIVESMMREYLEYTFFIRPRTKEFLIGYPFLLIGFLFVDIYLPRKWIWFFNTIGVVALISVFNSFCHFHTPILISLYRSFLGMLIGSFVGIIYIVAFLLIQRMFRKFQ